MFHTPLLTRTMRALVSRVRIMAFKASRSRGEIANALSRKLFTCAMRSAVRFNIPFHIQVRPNLRARRDDSQHANGGVGPGHCRISFQPFDSVFQILHRATAVALHPAVSFAQCCSSGSVFDGERTRWISRSLTFCPHRLWKSVASTGAGPGRSSNRQYSWSFGSGHSRRATRVILGPCDCRCDSIRCFWNFWYFRSFVLCITCLFSIG